MNMSANFHILIGSLKLRSDCFNWTVGDKCNQHVSSGDALHQDSLLFLVRIPIIGSLCVYSSIINSNCYPRGITDPQCLIRMEGRLEMKN